MAVFSPRFGCCTLFFISRFPSFFGFPPIEPNSTVLNRIPRCSECVVGSLPLAGCLSGAGFPLKVGAPVAPKGLFFSNKIFSDSAKRFHSSNGRSAIRSPTSRKRCDFSPPCFLTNEPRTFFFGSPVAPPPGAQKVAWGWAPSWRGSRTPPRPTAPGAASRPGSSAMPRPTQRPFLISKGTALQGLDSAQQVDSKRIPSLSYLAGDSGGETIRTLLGRTT